jgi:SAM-dependent methyltransferase
MSSASSREHVIQNLVNFGWGLTRDMVAAIDQPTLDFMSYELGADRSMAAYLERIDRLGMVGCEHVVDFGCGVGQWSLALARRNARVTGIDKTLPRIAVARHLAEIHGAANLRLGEALADFDDLVDNSVDAIFCYSVFMFIDGPVFIDQFHRLLKTGGKLYIMVDLPAWHLRALIRKPGALPSVGFMVLNSLVGGRRNIIYTRRRLDALLRGAGFTIRSSGADGEASFRDHHEIQPKAHSDFLPNKWVGMQTLYEVCAVKSESRLPPAGPPASE